MKRYRVAVPLLIITGFMLFFTAQAQNAVPFRFSLAPASDQGTACLAVATATLSVFPKEAFPGVDTLDLETEGLLPDTTFTVFLTEPAYAPFSAAQFIGDFQTNADGRASMRADTVVGDAFSGTTAGGGEVRKDMNHIVLWFSDRAAGNVCFANGAGPITALDREDRAEPAALSSSNFLPRALIGMDLESNENIYEEVQRETFDVWRPRAHQWQLAR